MTISHASQIQSHADTKSEITSVLRVINEELSLAPSVIKLKGKVSLIADQINQRADKDKSNILEECLYSYQNEGNKRMIQNT